jgi:hypothetical protein
MSQSTVPTRFWTIAGSVALASLGCALAARRPGTRDAVRARPSSVDAARKLNRAAGTLAACVLGDSALEHYRGAFHNKTMIAPLVSAALTLAASAHGAGDRRPRPHRLRHDGYALAVATGLIGLGFHFYNVSKRTGGLSPQNLFYGAPLGAPAALSLAGLLGMSAEQVRKTSPHGPPRILGMPAARVIAALTSAGLLGTVGEVGLLHFRGAYHNPAMYLPVSLPPIAAALLARSAMGTSPRRRRFARGWLRLTAFLGFAGAGFHVFGVARGMGGWRNWSQNLLNGPPLPAPPSFTALALAGLAALELEQRT